MYLFDFPAHKDNTGEMLVLEFLVTSYNKGKWRQTITDFLNQMLFSELLKFPLPKRYYYSCPAMTKSMQQMLRIHQLLYYINQFADFFI